MDEERDEDCDELLCVVDDNGEVGEVGEVGDGGELYREYGGGCACILCGECGLCVGTRVQIE